MEHAVDNCAVIDRIRKCLADPDVIERSNSQVEANIERRPVGHRQHSRIGAVLRLVKFLGRKIERDVDVAVLEQRKSVRAFRPTSSSMVWKKGWSPGQSGFAERVIEVPDCQSVTV